MVEVENIWKTYDELVAVRDVSFKLSKGDTLGLIGPNGAGKTTLLRMISSLAKPDKGRVLIDGHDVRTDVLAARKNLAFMPAEFGCPRNMTIIEYMTYFACMYGVHKHDRKQTISQVMELTDLSGRDDVLVRSLSTGNKQRLLLAKTLLNDPKLLILDEPSSGLDPRARTEIRAILSELSKMNKTIIISSHILADLQEICSHICIMEAGQLVEEGSLKDLNKKFTEEKFILKLRVVEEQLEQALETLKSIDAVMDAYIENKIVIVENKDSNYNQLLLALINANIEIKEFSEEQFTLEEIFVKSTEGKVT